MKYALHFLLLLLFYFFVVIIVFAALPSTNITEYSLKEKMHHFSLVDHTRCLLLFYSSSVWIYIYIYLILLIYIYYCWQLLSLSLSFSLFFLLLIDMVQNDYFFILMYIFFSEKEKEVVWSRSFDTIDRYHFRQQNIRHEKATIWLFLNI